jgi:predicted transcriptional regulator
MKIIVNKTDLLINTKGGARPLTDLEKCMFLILKTKNNIPSEVVLRMAKQFKICAACSDRSEVFYIGERLIKKGLAKRRLEVNKYIWSLTKKGIKFSNSI